jgi:P4 family phage/plasmid primase-like protien
MEVLTRILGKHNVANPTLTSLGGRFGLATLVGKQAAIIGDGHLGRQSDPIAILERLKSIVGGDPQNIDRKGRDEMTNVRVHARFTIAVNELPRFPDASAALHSRFLLIPFNVSFEGREDIDLKSKLLNEIPGITNWALDGLCELHRTGRLLQPEVGRELLDDFVRHSSPVKAFIEECCEVGAEKEVVSAELYCAWKSWCSEKGHQSGSEVTFGIKLKAAVRCSRGRKRIQKRPKYVYRGIGLTDETRKRLETVTSVIG